MSACAQDPSRIEETASPAVKASSYIDTNLLTRNSYGDTTELLVPIQIDTKTDLESLNEQDLTLWINGSLRDKKLLRPWSKSTDAAHDQPWVLVVLPPNQPLLNHVALGSLRTFLAKARQSSGNLPWTMSIFDANGTQSPFSSDAASLTATLQAALDAPQRLEPSAQRGGKWFDNASSAIEEMRPLVGRKIVIAFEPERRHVYGINDGSFMRIAPADLLDPALRAGAQVFVSNALGPDLGTVGLKGQDLQALSEASANGSALQDALAGQAAATGADFDNSIEDLARRVDAKAKGSYLLSFTPTPQDLDSLRLSARVTSSLPGLHITALTPYARLPIVREDDSNVSSDVEFQQALKQRSAASSGGSIQIAQRTEIVQSSTRAAWLPFLSSVSWSGIEKAPPKIRVYDALTSASTGIVMSAHKVTFGWNGSPLLWKRDNQLYPGRYRWTVVVQSTSGALLSTKSMDIEVPRWRSERVAISGLIVAGVCGKSRGQKGLRSRAEAAAAISVDPGADTALTYQGCRLMPEAAMQYTSADVLRALVRLSTSDKDASKRFANASAEFTVADSAGHVEMSRVVSPSTASASGYVAFAQLPLGALPTSGPHTLRFHLTDNMHKQLETSVQIDIR